MTDHDAPDTSPPKNYRIAALRDFLPLSADDSLSTRGQHLPGIIQSRSSGNLAAMRHRSYTRRRSSFGAEDLRKQPSHEDNEMDAALGRQGQVLSSMSNWGGGEDAEAWSRRLSIPASLITPQMRSQRLIGRLSWERRALNLVPASKATTVPY